MWKIKQLYESFAAIVVFVFFFQKKIPLVLRTSYKFYIRDTIALNLKIKRFNSLRVYCTEYTLYTLFFSFILIQESLAL